MQNNRGMQQELVGLGGWELGEFVHTISGRGNPSRSLSKGWWQVDAVRGGWRWEGDRPHVAL